MTATASSADEAFGCAQAREVRELLANIVGNPKVQKGEGVANNPDTQRQETFVRTKKNVINISIPVSDIGNSFQNRREPPCTSVLFC